MLLAALLATAHASVVTIPVTQDTLAEAAGDRIAVQCSPGGQRSTLYVRIKPPAGEVFVYAQLHTAAAGQPGWSGQLAATTLEDGRQQVALTAHADAPPATLDVLLDNSDPGRPAVGWLYQLDLRTFRC